MVQANKHGLDCVVFATAQCALPKNNTVQKHPKNVPLRLLFHKLKDVDQIVASSVFSTEDHQSFLELSDAVKLYPLWQSHNIVYAQSKVCNHIRLVHLCVCVCACAWL